MFYIYKNPDTLRYAIFMEILKFAKGWGHFYIQKHCTLRYIFISKIQCTFRYVIIDKNSYTLHHILICKKQRSLRYVFISKFNRIVYSDT